MRNTNNRFNLPPLDRLQQRNTAIRGNLTNAGTTIDSSRFEDWSTPILTHTPNNIFGGNLTFTPFQEPVRQDPSTLRWSDLSLQAAMPYTGKDKYEEKWREKYNDWRRLVVNVKPGELNSNFIHYKHFQSKKTIEPLLLHAIANEENFHTKTTSFAAKSYNVSLFGHSIVSIDRDTFEIKKVSFPKEIASAVKLFRFRLRQLGLRCIVMNKVNRLYLTKEYWVPLTVGQTIEIPKTLHIVCLPDLIYKREVVELPRQAVFSFANDWEELTQFREEFRTYKYNIFTRPIGKEIELKVEAKSTYNPDVILNKYVRINPKIGNHSIKFAIEKLIDNIYTQIYVEEDKRIREKESKSYTENWRGWGATATPFAQGQTITTTAGTSMGTFTIGANNLTNIWTATTV